MKVYHRLRNRYWTTGVL